MGWPWNFILFVGIMAVVLIVLDAITPSSGYYPGKGAGTPVVDDD